MQENKLVLKCLVTGVEKGLDQDSLSIWDIRDGYPVLEFHTIDFLWLSRKDFVFALDVPFLLTRISDSLEVSYFLKCVWVKFKEDYIQCNFDVVRNNLEIVELTNKFQEKLGLPCVNHI